MASKPRGKRAAKAAAGAGENVVDDVPVSVSAVSGKNADTNTKPLKETTNNLTLEEELEAMTKALKKVSLEKEQGEALLKAKEEELMAKTLEAERVQEQLNDSVEGKKKLEEKLRKLQKLKEFQPTLVNNLSLFYFFKKSYPLPSWDFTIGIFHCFASNINNFFPLAVVAWRSCMNLNEEQPIVVH